MTEEILHCEECGRVLDPDLDGMFICDPCRFHDSQDSIEFDSQGRPLDTSKD